MFSKRAQQGTGQAGVEKRAKDGSRVGEKRTCERVFRYCGLLLLLRELTYSSSRARRKVTSAVYGRRGQKEEERREEKDGRGERQQRTFSHDPHSRTVRPAENGEIPQAQKAAQSRRERRRRERETRHGPLKVRLPGRRPLQALENMILVVLSVLESATMRDGGRKDC